MPSGRLRTRADPRSALLGLLAFAALALLYLGAAPLLNPDMALTLGLDPLTHWWTAVADRNLAITSGPAPAAEPARSPAGAAAADGTLRAASAATEPRTLLVTLPTSIESAATWGEPEVRQVSAEGGAPDPATAAPVPARAGPVHEVAPGELPPTPVNERPTPEPVAPAPAAAPVRPSAQTPPTRLVIPGIGVDIPVEPVGLVGVKQKTWTEAWDTVPDAGGFHNTTAQPGHPGNIVINGHRDTHAAVFWSLNKTKLGDRIILYVDDVAYPYVVTEAHKVRYLGASSEELDEHQRLIGAYPEERLTLLTCAPVGLATHRLYVVAQPVVQSGAAADAR